MPVPSYGALPLSKTFLYVRALSLVSMVGIVGICANFVSEIVASGVSPPKEIIGTLSVVCLIVPEMLARSHLTLLQTSIAALYCLISIPFYYSQGNLSLFIMTGIDSLLLLAFIIVSVVLGKPLSFLNCLAIENGTAAENASGADAFILSLVSNVKNSTLGLFTWAGSTRVNCFETKAIWGLCIALW